MISKKNKLLFADVMTGLVLASFFAMIAPEAFAQQGKDFEQAVNDAKGGVGIPFTTLVSYISYGLGIVMMVSGITSIKKHSQDPSQEPLNRGLGKVGAGSAFLAAPFVANMLLSTGEKVVGSQTSTHNSIGW